MLIDNINRVCESKGTTLTAVLRQTGFSTGSTGNWKTGKTNPRLDILVAIANYLGVSIDELVYGEAHNNELSAEDSEWLSIIHRIPPDKRAIAKAFLETHIVEPEKYKDKKNA